MHGLVFSCIEICRAVEVPRLQALRAGYHLSLPVGRSISMHGLVFSCIEIFLEGSLRWQMAMAGGLRTAQMGVTVCRGGAVTGGRNLDARFGVFVHRDLSGRGGAPATGPSGGVPFVAARWSLNLDARFGVFVHRDLSGCGGAPATGPSGGVPFVAARWSVILDARFGGFVHRDWKTSCAPRSTAEAVFLEDVKK